MILAAHSEAEKARLRTRDLQRGLFSSLILMRLPWRQPRHLRLEMPPQQHINIHDHRPARRIQRREPSIQRPRHVVRRLEILAIRLQRPAKDHLDPVLRAHRHRRRILRHRHHHPPVKVPPVPRDALPVIRAIDANRRRL